MNELIEKLLEQCQIETYGVNGELLEIGVDAEKFTELIVRECADIAYKEADHLEDEFERGRADDLRRWANVMKKHFGVKE